MAVRPWTLDDLGTAVLAWFDASETSTLGRPASSDRVRTWTDRKNGIVATVAQDDARYSATVSRNLPSVTVNSNTEGQFRFPVSSSFPSGTAPSSSISIAISRPGNPGIYWVVAGYGVGGRGMRRETLTAGSISKPGSSIGFNDTYLTGKDTSTIDRIMYAGFGIGQPEPQNYTAIVDGYTANTQEGTATLATPNEVNGSVGYLLFGGPSLEGAYFYLREHAFFSRLLTTDERQRAEGYLAWKWGVQANLDAAHPYKSAAPTVTVADPSTIGTSIGLSTASALPAASARSSGAALSASIVAASPLARVLVSGAANGIAAGGASASAAARVAGASLGLAAAAAVGSASATAAAMSLGIGAGQAGASARALVAGAALGLAIGTGTVAAPIGTATGVSFGLAMASAVPAAATAATGSGTGLAIAWASGTARTSAVGIGLGQSAATSLASATAVATGRSAGISIAFADGRAPIMAVPPPAFRTVIFADTGARSLALADQGTRLLALADAGGRSTPLT